MFRALLDADAVAKWRAPVGMTAKIHEFDPREGGRFRVSLTYDAPTDRGKTTAQTDTYHGYFACVVPDEKIVEVIEFETDKPELQGEITVTTTLADKPGGTEISVTYQGLPSAISEHDNATGTRMALDNLADLVEREREDS